MLYFTSDTHYGVLRTMWLSNRDEFGDDINKMNQVLIDNFNGMILNSNDVTYHLGDFGDYDICRKLNGKIRLILGNHEHEYMKLNKLTSEQFVDLLVNKYGFDEVITDKVIELHSTIFSSSERILLTHEPVNVKPYVNDNNTFALFGHIHNTQTYKKFGLNVGVDCHNYYPLSVDKVLDHKNTIKKYCDENVWM